MSASYLDLDLEIDNEGNLKSKLYDKRDDFNFPIVNFPFHSCAGTFQQHLRMAYIFPNLYATPEHVFPIWISQIEDCC